LIEESVVSQLPWQRVVPKWLCANRLNVAAAAVAMLIAVLLIAQPATALGQARGPARMSPRMQRMMELQEQEQMQQQGPGVAAAPAPPEVDGLGPWLRRVHEIIPLSAADFADADSASLTDAAQAVEKWVVLWGRVAVGQPPEEKLNILRRLIDAEQLIDRQLDDLLIQRIEFASLPDDGKRHGALLKYLKATAALVDLSGRLRYSLSDAIDEVAGALSEEPGMRERLIDLLTEKRSSVGAEIMCVELFDSVDTPKQPTDPSANPPGVVSPGGKLEANQNEGNKPMSGRRATMAGGTTPMPAMPRRMGMAARMQLQSNEMSALARSRMQAADGNVVPPLSPAQKLKLIRLLATAGTTDVVSDLADFIADDATPPTLMLAAAEAIRTLGLPQDPRPGNDPALPQPAITAANLRDRLLKIDRSRWTSDEQRRLNALTTWLSERSEHGLEGDTYRLGQFDVHPGDWLLMHNPSPYNLFTDLSPGLFTHVGVVTIEKGSDGRRRMVVVDLPELGTSMPATNVEAFLQRTLNYVFLRHPDPAAASKMAETAATTIGNPTEFDLNFRTDRVAALKGTSLAGQKIHTYCAGLLMMCAQETGLPQNAFFPISETTGGGHLRDNIAKLGLSVGDGFVSPTGAIFSPQLKIVGRSEPMYEPRREIEEAIYDHFADNLAKTELHPAPNLLQSLRQKMAEAAKSNVVLTQALAATAGVSQQMDLVAAAKAKAVVETLDDIAYGASDEFQAARRAILDGGPDLTDQERQQLKPDELAALEKYRSRHADLAARWDVRQISPRGLRIELVNYYTDQGRRQLDERFFSSDK
jgi:hypothetical protein